MQKRTQQLLLMLVIGILIGSAIVMTWRSHTTGLAESATNSTPSGASTTLGTVSATTTVIGAAAGFPIAPEIPVHTRTGLTVSDQAASTHVSVSGLSVTENHWIAIYDDRDGRPGWILGAGRVRPEDTTAVIELLRSTTAGARYYAAILNDNGDDSFNRLTDLPPLSPDKVTIVSFVAE